MLFSFPAYAMIAVAAILSIVAIRRPARNLATAALFSTVLLALYVIVRGWFSPISYLARPDTFMAAGCLMVYLLTALCLTESRQRLWIIGVLFVVAVMEVGVSVVQFTQANGFMLFGFIRANTTSRASGMFICGNHLAGYLEVVALLALSITCWSRWPVWAKLVTAYLVLMCYFGLAISGSRGGYLSAGFSLIVFLGLSLWIVRMITRERFVLTLFVAVLALVFSVGVGGKLMLKNQMVRQRFNLLGTATQDVRRYNWLAALDQARLSPWIGTGAGTHLIYGRLFRRPQIQTDPVHAHGDYLEMLADYGILGALLSAVFLVSHFASGLRGARQLALQRLRGSLGAPRSDTLAIDLGAMGAIAALLAHSVVDFNMHIPGNALVYAFLFGILATPASDRQKSMEPPAWLSTPMLFRTILFLAGIAMLASTVPKYKGEQLAEQARVALRDHRNAECIALAAAAIEEEPNNPDTYFYLGEANRLTGMGVKSKVLRRDRLEHAVEAYRLGLQRFPQDENLLVRMGQALDGLGNFNEAEAAYQEAIRWDPGLGIIYSYYGAHFHLFGFQASSKICYRAAEQLGAERASETGMSEVRSLLELNGPPEENRALLEEIH